MRQPDRQKKKMKSVNKVAKVKHTVSSTNVPICLILLKVIIYSYHDLLLAQYKYYHQILQFVAFLKFFPLCESGDETNS